VAKSINMVKFYDAYGALLRVLKVPGEVLTGFSWEGSGLRLALAVDHFIFFANVRPSYIWACFGNTLAYTYYRPERRETALMLWNLTTNDTQVSVHTYIYSREKNKQTNKQTMREKKKQLHPLKHTALSPNIITSCRSTQNLCFSPAGEIPAHRQIPRGRFRSMCPGGGGAAN
jgi:hypothetical protein